VCVDVKVHVRLTKSTSAASLSGLMFSAPHSTPGNGCSGAIFATPISKLIDDPGCQCCECVIDSGGRRGEKGGSARGALVREKMRHVPRQKDPGKMLSALASGNVAQTVRERKRGEKAGGGRRASTDHGTCDEAFADFSVPAMSLTHARAISDPSDMRRHRRRFLMVCGQDTSAEARVCVCVRARARAYAHAHAHVCACVCQDGSRGGQDGVIRHPDAMPRKAPFTAERFTCTGCKNLCLGGRCLLSTCGGCTGPLGCRGSTIMPPAPVSFQPPGHYLTALLTQTLLAGVQCLSNGLNGTTRELSKC
jgi:hypothetical protein